MASMEERPGMQEINLMSLALPQLNQLKNQLDQVFFITNFIKSLNFFNANMSKTFYFLFI